MQAYMEHSPRSREVSDKFKALSHPHRLDIVQSLMEAPANVSALQAMLGIPQPSVSAHLARLRSAGIIEGIRQGQEIRYRLVDEDTRTLITAVMQ